MRIRVLLITTLLALGSCQTHTRSNTTLDRESFLQIYVHLLQEESRTKSTRPDSSDVVPIQRIFETYGATIEEFRATMKVYNSDIRQWKDFYEEVVRRLEERTPSEVKGSFQKH